MDGWVALTAWIVVRVRSLYVMTSESQEEESLGVRCERPFVAMTD